jgi:hypothetical protein
LFHSIARRIFSLFRCSLLCCSWGGECDRVWRCVADRRTIGEFVWSPRNESTDHCRIAFWQR